MCRGPSPQAKASCSPAWPHPVGAHIQAPQGRAGSLRTLSSSGRPCPLDTSCAPHVLPPLQRTESALFGKYRLPTAPQSVLAHRAVPAATEGQRRHTLQRTAMTQPREERTNYSGHRAPPGTGSQAGHLTGMIKSLRSPKNTVRQVPAALLDQSEGPLRLRTFPKVAWAAKGRSRSGTSSPAWGKAPA